MTSMELAVEQSNRRKYELDFLKIIPSDLKLFDSISVSSGQESELSGQFSDYVQGEGFADKWQSEELNKTDLYSYFSFSAEFKSAMESMKSERKAPVEETVMEEEEKLETLVEDTRIQKELVKKAEEMLRETRYVFREKKKSAETDDKKLGSSPDSLKVVKKPKAKKLKVYEDEEYFDTMSGYWRMLAAYDEFQISYPDYNAYKNEKPHWLETKPIPWEVIENSRKKCLEWLKEN